MQKKRLIGKRGPCLAVVAVLLFAGLFMTACLLDGIDNDEGKGTLLAPLGADQKNVPPVVNNPPRGQPVIDNPPVEPPVIDNPPEADDPTAEPPVTDNPPEEQPGPSMFWPPIQQYGTFPGLDVETERQIRLDYLDLCPALLEAYGRDDAAIQYAVHMTQYYGNYSGCELVSIAGSGGESRTTVAGMVFVSMSLVGRDKILVWKRGENPSLSYPRGPFYGLDEAYDLGFLTLEDVESLYKRFYEIFPYLEKHIIQRPLPPMPDHLCDFWGYKVPNCTFEGCEW